MPISKTKKTKLTKAQMRVAVARDVLKRIRTSFYRPTKGAYVAVRRATLPVTISLKPDAQVKPLVQSLEGKCEICAKGAIFLSTVLKYNDLKLGEVSNWSDLSSYYSIPALPHANIKPTNERLFSESQLELIERCFEGFLCDRVNGGWYRELCTAKVSGTASKNIAVLVAIMQNIIRNKGRFIPQQDIARLTKKPVRKKVTLK